MPKIDYEVAQQEIAEWLEFKHVSERKRADNEESEEVLVDNLAEGYLKVNENKSLEYTLKEPVQDDDGNVVLEKLTFKPRIRVGELNNRLKGVKPTDVEKRQLAYIAAVTNEAPGKLSKIFTEDYELCSAVINYFL